MTNLASGRPAFLSIGILAHNEAGTIGRALASLLRQTLWTQLAAEERQAEVVCVVNGSTDDTARVAAEALGALGGAHPHRHTCRGRVEVVPEPGKLNAWNLFVHRFSDPAAAYLILMDADILFGHTTTLWNLCLALESTPTAEIAVGEPVKDLALKKRKSLRDRLSLATSHMTQGAGAQLSGQLYCLRAATARRILLPRDLPACEDGLIKWLVCTEFQTLPAQPGKIVRPPDASYFFDAYIEAGQILRNQKRQMIGQTFVHVLVDGLLPRLSLRARENFARTVSRLDERSPGWLLRLVEAHLRRTRRFWRLFPGILTFRWRRLARLSGGQRVRHLPAALLGTAVTLVSCWLASRALRRGEYRYWPAKGRPAAACVQPTQPPVPG